MNLKELPDMTDAYRQVYEKKAAKDYDGDGKVESGAKEHAGAVHNAIQKKKGLKADGKDTRSEAVEMSKKDYAKIHKDFKSDDPKNPRTTKYVPGKGTVSMPVKFTDEYNPCEGEAATEAVYGGGKKEEPKKASAAAGTGKYYNEKKPTAMQLAKREKMAKVKALTNAGKHKEASALYKKEELENTDECWKTHKKVGMKMKGGKLVNDCRPKNEAFLFSEEELELLEQNLPEIDQLSDEELVDFFIEAIVELSEDEDDLLEICEHLEEVEYLEEAPGFEHIATGGSSKKEKPAPKKPSRMDRIKSAAKKAGSLIKKGVKKVAKKGAQAAGKVAGEFSAAKDKQKAKAMARKDDAPKKSSGVTKPTPSSTGVASRSTSGGGSSEGSSSGGSKGETRKAVGGALKKVGSLVKKGLKKAVGKTARLVSKGSDKVAKRLGEDFDQIESLIESGLFKWEEIENILEHHKKDADGNTIPHEGDEIEEAKVDKMLPDHKRSGKRLERYGNPHGSLALGGGIQRDRRADHAERRGKKTKGVKEGYDDSKISMRFGDGPEEQKKRKEKLEKKRGMKLDDHPQFKHLKGKK